MVGILRYLVSDEPLEKLETNITWVGDQLFLHDQPPVKTLNIRAHIRLPGWQYSMRMTIHHWWEKCGLFVPLLWEMRTGSPASLPACTLHNIPVPIVYHNPFTVMKGNNEYNNSSECCEFSYWFTNLRVVWENSLTVL